MIHSPEFIIPLLFGAYTFAGAGFVYTWLSVKGLYAALMTLRGEIREDAREIRENDMRHLEERLAKIEKQFGEK